LGAGNGEDAMSDDVDETLIFRDGNGGLYLLRCDLLLRCRVPEQERAAVEQSIAEVDVVGFGYPTSPVPPRPASSQPFRGLRLLGQWPIERFYLRGLSALSEDGRRA
jgi:hypothetical protein